MFWLFLVLSPAASTSPLICYLFFLSLDCPPDQPGVSASSHRTALLIRLEEHLFFWGRHFYKWQECETPPVFNHLCRGLPTGRSACAALACEWWCTCMSSCLPVIALLGVSAVGLPWSWQEWTAALERKQICRQSKGEGEKWQPAAHLTTTGLLWLPDVYTRGSPNRHFLLLLPSTTSVSAL